MGDKGKKDKGKREQQKTAQLNPKEKRKLKKRKEKVKILPQRGTNRKLRNSINFFRQSLSALTWPTGTWNLGAC